MYSNCLELEIVEFWRYLLVEVLILIVFKLLLFIFKIFLVIYYCNKIILEFLLLFMIFEVCVLG